VTRILAFYLPQFHPIPENDRWWGAGFTEWRNVVKGRPLFEGHEQPLLPSELGYYDLRVPEVRAAQADLARQGGIDGFCYYHYWFNGTRLLHRPLDEILETGRPDFPFCLCWANENWTRAWDGLDRDVLIAQRYSGEDDRRHLQWLARPLSDPRYIRVDDKALLLVYRVSQLPSPASTAMTWRDEAHRLGLGDLFLVSVESLRHDRVDPTRIGFDATVEFQPDWLDLGEPLFTVDPGNEVYSYETLVKRALAKRPAGYRQFPCVTPGWDNTSRRRQHARIFTGSSPDLYERWLRGALERAHRSSREPLVFVNAWNEWAEGACLEPSERWGRQYLEATRRVRDIDRTVSSPRAPSIITHARRRKVSVCIPTWNGATFLRESIQSVLSQSFQDLQLLIVDDASTDGSLDIARAFDDPRLSVQVNDCRQGLVKNWNRCLERASADYVCIFHQDDLMMPTNLERKVAMLEANPAMGFAHSSVWQIGPVGELISKWWYSEPQPEEDGIQRGRAVFDRLWRGPNTIACPSVVVRRSCFDAVGGFDVSLPFTADWEMWMRLALAYDVGYFVEALVHYRRHDSNETHEFPGPAELEHALLAKRRVLVNSNRIDTERERLLGEASETGRLEAVTRARDALARGNRAIALEYLAFAIRVPDLLQQTPKDQSGWLTQILTEWLVGVPAGADQDDDREELLATIANARAEVAALRTSLSWRVTGPLRSLYDSWLGLTRSGK
jgi:glycosyltransferase involved in cell wall biosynthesis